MHVFYIILCGLLIVSCSRKHESSELIIESIYVGKWVGHSDNIGMGEKFKWEFGFKADSRFELIVTNDGSFREEFDGVWEVADNRITLFPEAAGKKFFPYVDEEFYSEGIGYQLEVTHSADIYEFTFICFDDFGGDYRILTKKLTEQGAASDPTVPV